MKSFFLSVTFIILTISSLIGQDCFDVIITYESLSKRINTHVGNEYYYSVSIAGVLVNLREKVKLTLCSNDYFEISCSAVDDDPVYDDDYVENQLFYYSDFKEGVFSFEREVVVRENAGRYAGETSSFFFNFKIYITRYEK